MADKVIVTKADLVSLGDSIRAKTGTTNKMTVKAMKTAVDNITGSSSGGGSASVEWENKEGILIVEETGYDVPNYQEIYFNTNLSIDEVVNIINNETSITWYPIDMDDFEIGMIIGINANPVYAVRSVSRNLISLANLAFLNMVSGGNGEGAELYFSSAEVPEFGLTLVGWNLECNSFSYSQELDLSQTIKNRKLFSNLPFEKKQINLTGNYTGSDLLLLGINQEINMEDLLNDKKIPRKIIVVKDNLDQVQIEKYQVPYFCHVGDDEFLQRKLESLDFSKIYNFSRMFYNNAEITYIPEKVANILINNENISFGEFDFMFNNCTSLSGEVNIKINSGAINHMQSAFYNTKITSIKIEANFINNMSSCFSACTELQNVEINSLTNTVQYHNVQNIFYGCSALKNLKIKNIPCSLQVGSGTEWGHLLTVESLVGLCKECINKGSALTLTVGSANLDKIQNSGKFYKFVDPSVTEVAVGEKGEIEECESTVTGSFSITDYMAMKNWTLA